MIQIFFFLVFLRIFRFLFMLSFIQLQFFWIMHNQTGLAVFVRKTLSDKTFFLEKMGTMTK